jgi:hypothetical protein
MTVDETRQGHPDPDELTPAERAAFEALPRALEPGRLLEERTVRALRERGVLARRGRIAFPRAWLAAGVAASVAVFACGIAAGQWMAGRQAAMEISELRKADEARAAAAVKETGAAYVAALSALARTAGGDGRGADAARATATQGLTAAAREVLRVAPDDPVAAGILAGYDRQRTARQTAADTLGKQRVVWF